MNFGERAVEIELFAYGLTADFLEFLAIRGRTYTIQVSPNLQQWTPVSFRLVTDKTLGVLQNNYQSTDVRKLRVEVPFQTGAETNRYFRALVQ